MRIFILKGIFPHISIDERCIEHFIHLVGWTKDAFYENTYLKEGCKHPLSERDIDGQCNDCGQYIKLEVDCLKTIESNFEEINHLVRDLIRRPKRER